MQPAAGPQLPPAASAAGFSGGSAGGDSLPRLLLWLLFVSQLGYFGVLLAVRPHIDLLRSMATIGCALLQAGTVLCTCLLLVRAPAGPGSSSAEVNSSCAAAQLPFLGVQPSLIQ